MFDFLALFFISLGALIGLACAINFFWRLGPWYSLGAAGFVVCVFLIFWRSGLWEGAARHSWGILTPVFFLIIAVTGAVISLLGAGARIYMRKRHKRTPKPRWEKR